MKKKKNEGTRLFSKALSDTLEPFGSMSCAEALESEYFMRTLCRHGGMSDEKFDEILDESRQKGVTQEERDAEADKIMAEVEAMICDFVSGNR